jgi:murein DD-endopeptidase MepM/ murein hydrolase activator NlpD
LLPNRLDKPIVLRSTYRRPQRGAGRTQGSAFFVVLMLAALNYGLFFAGNDGVAPPTLEERLNHPVAVPQPHDPTSAAEPESATPTSSDQDLELLPLDDFGEPMGRKVAGKLRRGQTILKALKGEGVDHRTALPLTHAMAAVFDFRNAQVGDDFKAWLDDEGQVLRFRYEQTPLDVFEVVATSTGDYRARKVAVPTRVELARVGCAIKSSLYGAIARCGEGARLGGLFIDLFAWDVDFFQDVRQGDEFRVIVEKISVDGHFLKYGKVLAAEYHGKFGHKRIVHYTNPQGDDGYFTDGGRAVRKEFLKSPLKYTRVSSRGQSGIRHGLKKASPVIYTASAGTPVWAVSNGTVIFAGESGSLGKTVTIKHDNGYTSTYGHLEAIGRHVKVGTVVNQKSLIGKVGQSGIARAPKLLFSVRKNGKLVNPLRTDFIEGDPVPDEHRAHFETEVDQLLRDLEATPITGIHERHS